MGVRGAEVKLLVTAVMKDGRRISGKQLKHELLINPEIAPEDGAANFRSDVESSIDYLVLVPANFQRRNRAARSIGPWKFNELDHSQRRELRAVAVLAAWIGWYDTRFHNTRLKVLESSSQRPQLAHYFSDLGAGLGKAHGLFSGKAELPNDFGWTFTEPPKVRGKGHMTTPFRIIGFRAMEPNAAFEAMTFEDARWMARLIAQLTESQLVQALMAAGFDSAEVRLYTEKLISRRDQMICDLGLREEIGLLRPGGINHKFNYDPFQNGEIATRLPSGEKITAPVSHQWVKDGQVGHHEAVTTEVHLKPLTFRRNLLR